MTKTIEFIERKIKGKKDQLKRLENLKTVSNKYELQINELLTKNTEEDIENLEQIKTELEAWEVVKDNLWIAEHMQENLNIIAMYEINKSINKKEFDTIKKALEVEDE